MTISKVTDHAEAARLLTKGRWRDKDRMQALVKILADEVQLLENVTWDVLQSSLLGNAEGAILDEYGDMFDEPRGALVDADYRRVLGVIMGAHQSDATAPETIYLFAQLADATVRYIQQGRASFSISYDTDNPALEKPDWRERLQRIAEILRPVCVSMSVVEGDTSDSGNPFQLDTDGQGLDLGELCDRVV